MTWTDIHKRFRAIGEITGMGKVGSYSMDIGFDMDGNISIHLFTYDIADWNRHTNIGPFKSEDEAMAATIALIEKAESVAAPDD